MLEMLSFPEGDAQKLDPYLPLCHDSGPTSKQSVRPFVTLTFATSLDSSLSLAPGIRTRLSGPESKAMTHFLRSRHDAICVGVGTAIADDPALNCRISGGSQPRPIIIDPHARWQLTTQSKVLETAREGRGKAPLILIGTQTAAPTYLPLLEEVGGKVIAVELNQSGRFAWQDILDALQREGLKSVMIEGGGSIINSLLHPANHDLIDSVIVTVAPTWLGRGGVVVSPDRVCENGNAIPAARLTGVSWHPLGEDVVLCGKL